MHKVQLIEKIAEKNEERKGYNLFNTEQFTVEVRIHST